MSGVSGVVVKGRKSYTPSTPERILVDDLIQGTSTPYILKDDLRKFCKKCDKFSKKKVSRALAYNLEDIVWETQLKSLYAIEALIMYDEDSYKPIFSHYLDVIEECLELKHEAIQLKTQKILKLLETSGEDETAPTSSRIVSSKKTLKKAKGDNIAKSTQKTTPHIVTGVQEFDSDEMRSGDNSEESKSESEPEFEPKSEPELESESQPESEEGCDSDSPRLQGKGMTKVKISSKHGKKVRQPVREKEDRNIKVQETSESLSKMQIKSKGKIHDEVEIEEHSQEDEAERKPFKSKTKETPTSKPLEQSMTRIPPSAKTTTSSTLSVDTKPKPKPKPKVKLNSTQEPKEESNPSVAQILLIEVECDTETPGQRPIEKARQDIDDFLGSESAQPQLSHTITGTSHNRSGNRHNTQQHPLVDRYEALTVLKPTPAQHQPQQQPGFSYPPQAMAIVPYGMNLQAMTQPATQNHPGHQSVYHAPYNSGTHHPTMQYQQQQKQQLQMHYSLHNPPSNAGRQASASRVSSPFDSIDPIRSSKN